MVITGSSESTYSFILVSQNRDEGVHGSWHCKENGHRDT